MELEKEILINKFAQGLIDISSILAHFDTLDLGNKRLFLNELSFLIMQSKPVVTDTEIAIKDSLLKSSFTPCVLLSKGPISTSIQKIIALPEPELGKAVNLLLNLFKVAYVRRFEAEKNNPSKWWYWDLSNEQNIKAIKE